MSVREDKVEFANSHQGVYGVVDKRPFSPIIPFDGEKFYLVGQYRYPVEMYSWEFPSGGNEDWDKIDTEKLSKAELAEELGLVANKVTKNSLLFIPEAAF